MGLMKNENIRYGFHWLSKDGIDNLDFFGSKVENDPLVFIEKVSRMLNFVSVTPAEKEKLVAY